MTYDFDTSVDRRNSDSGKWRKYRDRDVIPMWVADMDFRSPPEVVEALRRRAEHGVFGYTSPQSELVDAVVALYRDRFGWTIDPAWLLWLPSVGTALNLVCQAASDKGDEVITTTPVYPPFLSAAGAWGRRRVVAPLACDGRRWQMDFDAIEAAITPRTRLFLLCSPHNPVGRAWTEDELRRLAELCVERDLVLCSDEVHCQLVLDEDRRHVPTASLSDEIAQRTVTLMSPSKTYNVPGLKCAFAVVSDDALRERLRQAQRGLTGGGNIFGYTAATAALARSEPWRLALIEYLRGNRDLVERTIAETPGLSMTHVEATYLAWIDARELGPEDPRRFFEDAGVGLEDGREFGRAGYVRLNFGCPRATLAEALERIRRAVSRA